jgi:putative OPT family oligopeptide transporter
VKPSELTIRGLILGSLIAIIFTAANVYLGLRVGITIASSIPAAVISMGIFRLFNTGSIRENNIVQTVASAGGTLSAIIFVLPGLVMIGYWRNFDFLTTFLICALGGTLGVLFSIPLRRALVVNSPLPFPEGVAAAEVLKVGATGDEAPQNVLERNKGPLIVLWGAIVAAGAQLVSFMGFATTAITQLFRVGQGVSGLTVGLSLALAGAGHLVGISVGIAMLIGLLISWAGLMPILTAGVPGDIAEVAETVFRGQVRFVGAGAIGIAAIWSLIKLVGPLIKGVSDTMAAGSAAKTGAHDDRDIPLGMIALLSAICLAAIAALLYLFIQGTPLASLGWPLIAGGVVFTVVVGAFIATVAGYMAGLIGASNSPVSGIGILAIVSGSVLLAMFVQPLLDAGATDELVAFALFTVAIVFSIATISNDNLQDLKTGQLVGASPWRQQIALIVGVIAGSLVIGPVLDLLNRVQGFAGDPNRDAIMADPLGAPQATLISSLARGVLNADLDWNLILMGVGIGVVVIFIDEILGFLKVLRIPPLAVGIGMYLPQDVTTPVVLGAVIGYFYNKAVEKRENGEMAKRFGILLACGLIVGESLLGIANAALVYFTDNPAPIAIAPEQFGALGPYVGLALFALLLLVSYLWVARQSRAK